MRHETGSKPDEQRLHWDYAVKTMLDSLEDDRLHQQRLLDGGMESMHAALRRKHIRTVLADSGSKGFRRQAVGG
jgi:hypothetical protein